MTYKMLELSKSIYLSKRQTKANLFMWSLTSNYLSTIQFSSHTVQSEEYIQSSIVIMIEHTAKRQDGQIKYCLISWPLNSFPSSINTLKGKWDLYRIEITEL